MANLRIRLSGESPSGKTSLFYVENSREGGRLGNIRWYAPWRRYVFYPEPDTLWDSSCLMEVMQFLNVLMAERRAGKEV